MVKGPLAAQYTEDQFGEQTPVRAGKSAVRQLAVDQLVGEAALFPDLEENRAGCLAWIGGVQIAGAQ
jgi:hypothetical protein